MANNVCMSYLEKVIPVFKEKMETALNKGDRTTMKHFQALWMESTKKKNAIEQACGNGAMTPEEYVAIQKRQIEKDTKLLAYFKQTNATAKATIVAERISDTKIELQSFGA